MRYYTCKCGNLQCFGSDPPSPCVGCDKCNTNCYRETPKDHELRLQYDENTGEPKHYICTRCYHRFPLRGDEMNKSIQLMTKAFMINESQGEPTEDDHSRYKEAAKKMVDEIEKRSGKAHPNRQELEDTFYQNMCAMKRGDIGSVGS